MGNGLKRYATIPDKSKDESKGEIEGVLRKYEEGLCQARGILNSTTEGGVDARVGACGLSQQGGVFGRKRNGSNGDTGCFGTVQASR